MSEIDLESFLSNEKKKGMRKFIVWSFALLISTVVIIGGMIWLMSLV